MVQTTKKRKARKAAPLPADVAAEWLTLPNSSDMAASVSLNGVEYAFSAHVHDGEVLGYRFVRPDPKSGEALVYDVTAADGTCTCWDCLAGRNEGQAVRGRRCKHSYSVEYLLASFDDALTAPQVGDGSPAEPGNCCESCGAPGEAPLCALCQAELEEDNDHAAEQERLEAEQEADRCDCCVWCGRPEGMCFPCCRELMDDVADEVIRDERDADRAYRAAIANGDNSGAWFESESYMVGAGV